MDNKLDQSGCESEREPRGCPNGEVLGELAGEGLKVRGIVLDGSVSVRNSDS